MPSRDTRRPCARDSPAHGSGELPSRSAGLTAVGYRLVLVITGLSIAHHVDHVVRGVTGWPLSGGFNPFSASLFVYPVIGAGLLLSRRRRVGARFWALLAGGAALFIVLVHVGPTAGDSVSNIPDQYGSPVAAVVSLLVLALFVAALILHCAHEIRRMTS